MIALDEFANNGDEASTDVSLSSAEGSDTLRNPKYAKAAQKALSAGVKEALTKAMEKAEVTYKELGVSEADFLQSAIVHVGTALESSWNDQNSTMLLDLQAVFETTEHFVSLRLSELVKSQQEKSKRTIKSSIGHIRSALAALTRLMPSWHHATDDQQAGMGMDSSLLPKA